MSAMSLGPQQQQQQPSTSPYPNQAFSPQQSYPQHYSPQQSPSPGRGQSPSQSQGPPALTAPLPTPESLTAARNALLPLTHPPHAGQSAADHVRWIRDVFFCVDRSISQQQSPDASTEHQASIVLHAPLPALLHFAISILLTILSSAPSSQGQSGPVESHVAEALYLKSIVYASDPYLPSLASPNPSTSSRYSGSHVPHAGGAFEDLEHSPRLAFQTFSSAARFGFLPAWFKLGRDYELVGDATRARECFERGAGVGGGKASVGCLYVSCCFYSVFSSLLALLPCPPSCTVIRSCPQFYHYFPSPADAPPSRSASEWPISSVSCPSPPPLPPRSPSFTAPLYLPLPRPHSPHTSTVLFSSTNSIGQR